jgi:hypothetical protein
MPPAERAKDAARLKWRLRRLCLAGRLGPGDAAAALAARVDAVVLTTRFWAEMSGQGWSLQQVGPRRGSGVLVRRGVGTRPWWRRSLGPHGQHPGVQRRCRLAAMWWWPTACPPALPASPPPQARSYREMRRANDYRAPGSPKAPRASRSAPSRTRPQGRPRGTAVGRPRKPPAALPPAEAPGELTVASGRSRDRRAATGTGRGGGGGAAAAGSGRLGRASRAAKRTTQPESARLRAPGAFGVAAPRVRASRPAGRARVAAEDGIVDVEAVAVPREGQAERSEDQVPSVAAPEPPAAPTPPLPAAPAPAPPPVPESLLVKVRSAGQLGPPELSPDPGPTSRPPALTAAPDRGPVADPGRSATWRPWSSASGLACSGWRARGWPGPPTAPRCTPRESSWRRCVVALQA